MPSFLAIPVARALGVVKAPHPSGYDGPDSLITQACHVTTWIFAAAIILSIVMVLLAGIEYMRSSGDPAKVKTATSRLIWAAVGVAVALLAYSFPAIISRTIGAGSIAGC